MFPGSLATARIVLSAAMYRVHILRISTKEQGLESAIMESLQYDWRQHRVRFPPNAQVVMCHLVYFPGQWMWTSHAGVMVQSRKRYTYLEKAGGRGPFVRIDLSDSFDLMAWFAALFKKSASEGYTHLFVTFNDTTIFGEKLRP
jgi:hypothetical protein